MAMNSRARMVRLPVRLGMLAGVGGEVGLRLVHGAILAYLNCQYRSDYVPPRVETNPTWH